MNKNFNINEFDYDLPKDRIASEPLENRDESKLLFCNENGEISHHIFSDIVDLIPQGSLIAFNKTKVISARILCTKPTGGKAELLLFEPHDDYQISLSSRKNVVWKCIVGGRKINPGIELFAENQGVKLTAKIIEKTDNEADVEFEWNSDITFAEVLNIIGNVPLPPYIKREAKKSDKQNYQTVYAKYDGSVAAPTAGLHFTDNVLKSFKQKKIGETEVTLHVGLGTFLPVVDDDVTKHVMHRETIIIKLDEIKKIRDFFSNRNANQLFIATGTTSVRTLESLYWHAVKVYFNKIDPSIIKTEQWIYNDYDNINLPKINELLDELIIKLEQESIEKIEGETSLMIVPGYEFKLIEALITNFHMPKSTLLMLISAFVGDDIRRSIYESALNNDYRFLSYGDSSFLIRK
jgi:S-adenosylmethionine:tRNA ribosyltransferase-isomerase